MPITEKKHRQNVGGVTLAYSEWAGDAQAPAVLCLPHLTGHKGSFRQLGQALAPSFRVLALDLRGRGDSDQPPEGYGFAYHARDILTLADALGLERFTLVGHSFGATTAAYLASIRPGRVLAAVLIDGGADPKDETLRAMYPTIRRLGQVYPSVEAYLDAMRAVPFFEPWNPALEAYFREDATPAPGGGVTSKSSAAAIERDLDQHFLYSMCLHFPALQCPTLFLRPEVGLLGQRGHVFTEREAAAVTAHIRRCRWLNLPGVNHYTILLSDPTPVIEPIRAYLTEVVGQSVDQSIGQSAE
jgi:pimeloyl-ACP methyl ester carboxylesterase